MKTTLANPVLNKVVRDFIANPDAEFPKTTVTDKLTNKPIAKPHGFTQRQQALCLLTCLHELGLMVQAESKEQQEQDFVQALTVIYDQCNGSASRQTLEGADLLAKTEGAKRGGDPVSMAAKWMKNVLPTSTEEETTM